MPSFNLSFQSFFQSLVFPLLCFALILNMTLVAEGKSQGKLVEDFINAGAFNGAEAAAKAAAKNAEQPLLKLSRVKFKKPSLSKRVGSQFRKASERVRQLRRGKKNRAYGRFADQKLTQAQHSALPLGKTVGKSKMTREEKFNALNSMSSEQLLEAYLLYWFAKGDASKLVDRNIKLTMGSVGTMWGSFVSLAPLAGITGGASVMPNLAILAASTSAAVAFVPSLAKRGKHTRRFRARADDVLGMWMLKQRGIKRQNLGFDELHQIMKDQLGAPSTAEGETFADRVIKSIVQVDSASGAVVPMRYQKGLARLRGEPGKSKWWKRIFRDDKSPQDRLQEANNFFLSRYKKQINNSTINLTVVPRPSSGSSFLGTAPFAPIL